MITNYAPILYKKFDRQYNKNGLSATTIKTEPKGLLRKPIRASENSLKARDKKNDALEYWGIFRQARDELKVEKGDN